MFLFPRHNASAFPGEIVGCEGPRGKDLPPELDRASRGIFGGLETFGLIGLLLGPGIMSVLIAMRRALIQDAAYENLLKRRRQALHRRVAEGLDPRLLRLNFLRR